MTRTTTTSTLLLATLLALPACGDDDGDTDATPPDLGGADASDVDAFVPDEPVFVLATNTFTPDSSNGNVLVSATLTEDRELDLADAVEVPGGGVVYGDLAFPGVAFVGGAEDPALTRFQVGADGSLEEGGQLSFFPEMADFNIRANHVELVSETKAYVFDRRGANILVWNPTAFERGETIELTELVPEAGESGDFGYVTYRRGDDLFITYNYRADDFYDVMPRTALVVVDTVTDEVTIDVREGCGEMTLGAEASDGTLYYATGVHGTSVNHTTGADDAPAPCLLRVLPGETAWDAGFEEDPRTLVGDRPAGDLVPGPGDLALLRVYDEAEVPLPADADGFAMRGSPGWRWWAVDLGALTATELTETELAAGNTLVYRVGGDSFLLKLAADFSASTLQRVRDDGALVDGIRVPGVLQGGVVQVR